jgi:5-methylcytosine-specific restriction endonuclease McrA
MDTRSWPIPLNLATTDHIVPSSKGGKFSVENVVLSCMPCNADRGDMPADEYLALVESRKNAKESA